MQPGSGRVSQSIPGGRPRGHSPMVKGLLRRLLPKGRGFSLHKLDRLFRAGNFSLDANQCLTAS